jgi:hypothetical protein
VGSLGTTIGCMTENKNTKRAVDPNDPSQSALTLDPAVISTGFQKDGQDNITNPGQGLFLILPSPLMIGRVDLPKTSAQPNFE